MQIVEPSFIIETPIDSNDIMKRIELIGRVCYKSEDKITAESSKQFVANLIKNGHESVLEHINLTIRFKISRGESHELVRHRLASFSQSSTRYCNYHNKDIQFIKPQNLNDNTLPIWNTSMLNAEHQYNLMIEYGATPQNARSVLPNSLMAEIVVTANLREWRHILRLRTSKKAHPDMRFIMLKLLTELKIQLPAIFGDIYE
jgi:thymidylate synthase (FAD)